MATESQTIAVASARRREQRKGIVLYWSSTALVLLQVGASAILMILRPAMVTALIQHLGYPLYFPVFLGIAKLLAVVAIVQPWSVVLKEWAYAGITFDVLAAAVSHISSHDSAREVAGPFLIVGLIALSYFGYVKLNRQDSTGVESV